jgi:diguanylate cyclase (GGDEF)-like protein/PAS domain S-box-containing protein
MTMESDFTINCRDILDHLPSGVYVTDVHRKIIYWNAAAERITGYSKETVMGCHCYDNVLMHIDETGQNLCKGLCPLAKTISDGNTREAEVFLHHKDGHRTQVKIFTMPVKNAMGEIIGAAEIFTDNSAFHSIESKIHDLEQKAYIDHLCQLPNRTQLEIELDRSLHELNRYDQGFGIFFMDVDHFKQFNDTYGHVAGDHILQSVARTLKSSSRPFDIFGRWGGEEFVGIIKKVDRPSLESIGNRYRKLIENTSITVDGDCMGITVSIGATMARADDSIASLIKRADELMYTCKQKGRNCLESG